MATELNQNWHSESFAYNWWSQSFINIAHRWSAWYTLDIEYFRISFVNTITNISRNYLNTRLIKSIKVVGALVSPNDITKNSNDHTLFWRPSSKYHHLELLVGGTLTFGQSKRNTWHHVFDQMDRQFLEVGILDCEFFQLSIIYTHP